MSSVRQLISPRWRRAAIILVVVGTAYGTRHVWLTAIGRSLICKERLPSAATIVIDNFDYNFWLFRRSADLQRDGQVLQVLVPTTANDEGDLSIGAREVANTFARVAKLSQWEIIPVREQEPISLNVAYQVRDFLIAQKTSSITLISSDFRSKRSEMIYRSVLAERGITVGCLPVAGTVTPETWTSTWHSVEEVGLQFAKLQYYRFWVLPLAHLHELPSASKPQN